MKEEVEAGTSGPSVRESGGERKGEEEEVEEEVKVVEEEGRRCEDRNVGRAE